MNVSMKWRLALAASAFALLPVSVMAQGYYDDDIYFDESKAKAKKTQTTTVKTAPAVRQSAKPVATVRVDRDVDEYNRRGSYKPVQNQTVDDLGDNFEYTRRIERFYNQDIVNESGDEDLVYYYTNANDELADINCVAPTTINIYVDNPDPWDGFWNPYYYSSAWSWAWRPTYYNPWYSWNYAWGYGPSWSWSWGWGGPSFSWGWSWGWGWNYPSWGWGWNPGWGWNHPGWGGGHHHPNYPGNNWGYNPPRPAGPGASRPSARPGYGSVASNRNPQRPTQNGTLSRNNSARGGRTPQASNGTSLPSYGTADSGVTASTGRGSRSSSARSGYNPSQQTRPGQSSVGTTNRGTSSSNRGTASSSSTNRNSGRSYNSGSSSSSSGRASSGRSSSSSSRSSYGTSSGSSSSRSSYGSGSSSYGGGRSSGGSYGGGGGRSSGGGGGRGGRH